MDFAIVVAVIGIGVSVLLWLFRPESIRRWVGLRDADNLPLLMNLEPYDLPGSEMQDFLRDSVIGDKIRQAHAAGASFALAQRHQLASKLEQGFNYLLTPDGRKCRFKGGLGSKTEELFLLVKPGGT